MEELTPQTLRNMVMIESSQKVWTDVRKRKYIDDRGAHAKILKDIPIGKTG